MQQNMQNTPPSRKRAAPGASPMLQQPMPQNPYQYPMQDNTDFSNFDFSNPLPPDQTYDSNAFDSNNFSYNLNTAQQQPAYGNAPTSQELVRRSRNNHLAPAQSQMQQGSAGEGWNGFNQYDDEDEADLERRVAAAKKDAQGKRKQIPPFVQKLSR